MKCVWMEREEWSWSVREECRRPSKMARMTHTRTVWASVCIEGHLAVGLAFEAPRVREGADSARVIVGRLTLRRTWGGSERKILVSGPGFMGLF